MMKDALGAHGRDELGISEVTTARPIQAALTSAATFGVGAALPLIMVLLLPQSSLVVGVSGGPDSLTLLHALNMLAPELELKLIVAHLNHQLRGEESDADDAGDTEAEPAGPPPEPEMDRTLMRVAIDEGAKAEYDVEAMQNRGWSMACAVCGPNICWRKLTGA